MLYWLAKALLAPPLRLLYHVRVKGLENVPRSGGAIIAANHRSFLDSIFIPLVIRRRQVVYLAKAEYFKSRRTGWFFRSMGQIPLERTGGKSSHRALSAALEVLRSGKLLGIYPEGTRSPDGRLHRGRTGVVRLALAAGVPVVPCGAIGTEEVMPKGAKLPLLRGRPRVEIRFGPALDLSRLEGKERESTALRAATDEIMAAIGALSGQDYIDEYATSGDRGPQAGSTGDDGDLPGEALAG